jgi:hypothetical protein
LNHAHRRGWHEASGHDGPYALCASDVCRGYRAVPPYRDAWIEHGPSNRTIAVACALILGIVAAVGLIGARG